MPDLPDLRDADADADADVDIDIGAEPPSARNPLDRARIVAAAVAYVDEHGLAGLSMRRLGAMLGVEAMALYRYVKGKEDLLDGIVDALVAEMAADGEVLDAPRDGWQDFLQRLAHGVRRIAISHPCAFPLIASRPPEAPWLRPPLRSIEWVEVFLAGLLSEGFDKEATADAYRAFTGFLLGHLLLEASTLGADVGPLDVLDDGTAAPGLEKAPLVQQLKSVLAPDNAAYEFEEALEHLLNRLALIRSESS